MLYRWISTWCEHGGLRTRRFYTHVQCLLRMQLLQKPRIRFALMPFAIPVIMRYTVKVYNRIEYIPDVH